MLTPKSPRGRPRLPRDADGRIFDPEGMNPETAQEWGLMDLKTFEKLPRVMVGRMSKQRRALWALRPDMALVMTHEGYRCSRALKKPEGSCSLACAAYYVAKARGLISSTKHLDDGRIVVAFYSKKETGRDGV